MANGDNNRYISKDNGDNGRKPGNTVTKVIGTKLRFFRWYAHEIFAFKHQQSNLDLSGT